jgi:predicted DNA binding CopG/RHH family protein
MHHVTTGSVYSAGQHRTPAMRVLPAREPRVLRWGAQDDTHPCAPKQADNAQHDAVTAAMAREAHIPRDRVVGLDACALLQKKLSYCLRLTQVLVRAVTQKASQRGTNIQRRL